MQLLTWCKLIVCILSAWFFVVIDYPCRYRSTYIMFTQKCGIVSCLSAHTSLINYLNFIIFVFDSIILKRDNTSTIGMGNARLISCYSSWFSTAVDNLMRKIFLTLTINTTVSKGTKWAPSVYIQCNLVFWPVTTDYLSRDLNTLSSYTQDIAMQ